MSILLIGDPHFKTKNAVETQNMHLEIIELIKNNNYKFVVIMGDILDTHEKIHMQPLYRASNFIKDISREIEVYILIGNHDRLNNSDYLTDIHPFNSLKEIKNIHIIDKVLKVEKYIFVPYVPNGRFKEALSTIEYNYNKHDIIFAHQEFKGCKMGAMVSECGDVWEENLPFVFSGHIHDYQVPQENIIYTGTPFQHGYSDNSKKFIIVLNEDKTWNKIDLKTIIKKRILYITLGDIKNYVVNEEYDTKLVIEGDGKLIKKALGKRKDIQNYKIRDNSFLELKNHLSQSTNFSVSMLAKIKKMDKKDQDLFNDIFM